MNIRRGLFRLWITFAALFALVTATLSYTEIRNEFFWRKPPADWKALLPVACDQARGAANTDYSTSQNLCWYEQDKFRALYPEYADLTEPELSKRLYAKAGQPLREMRPWTRVGERAVVLRVQRVGADGELGDVAVWESRPQ